MTVKVKLASATTKRGKTVQPMVFAVQNEPSDSRPVVSKAGITIPAKPVEKVQAPTLFRTDADDVSLKTRTAELVSQIIPIEKQNDADLYSLRLDLCKVIASRFKLGHKRNDIAAEIVPLLRANPGWTRQRAVVYDETGNEVTVGRPRKIDQDPVSYAKAWLGRYVAVARAMAGETQISKAQPLYLGDAAYGTLDDAAKAAPSFTALAEAIQRSNTKAIATSPEGRKLDGRKIQDILSVRAGKLIEKLKVPIEVRDKEGAKFVGIELVLLKDAPVQAWHGAMLTLLSYAPAGFPSDVARSIIQAIQPATTPEYMVQV